MDDLKKVVWEVYKNIIYPNAKVEMNDVFLPHCEDMKKEGLFWLFWIRLEEHLDVIDALRRLSILVDIFGNNEFIKKEL